MPRKTRGPTTSRMVEAARRLRRHQTPSERRLWAALRGRLLGTLKFRRQHAYHGFILDAFCVEHQLVVEVDGGVHLQPDQAAYDAERNAFLEARGIRVLRFTAEEVETALPQVLERILEATGRAA